MRASVRQLFPFLSRSPGDTHDLGAQLASSLEGGDVLALHGELGSGKTALAKGICAGLGVEPTLVHSPTYTLVNEYRLGTISVYHFDAYRLRSVEEFFDLGYEDYFYGNGICIVEWADRVSPLLPRDALRIHLTHRGPTMRHIATQTAP